MLSITIEAPDKAGAIYQAGIKFDDVATAAHIAQREPVLALAGLLVDGLAEAEGHHVYLNIRAENKEGGSYNHVLIDARMMADA